MLLAPALGEPPRAIAERLGDGWATGSARRVERVEIAGPGFLNLFMTDRWYLDALAALLEAGDEFGAGTRSAEHVNVEFVSANPTGPITVASARHAAYGDSLCRGSSSRLAPGRARVLRERRRQPGAPLRRVDPGARPWRGAARRRLPRRLRGRTRRSGSTERPTPIRTSWRARGIELMLEGVRATLARFRVDMDQFFSERTLHASGEVQAAIDRLRGRLRVTTARLAAHHAPTATTRTACCGARPANGPTSPPTSPTTCTRSAATTTGRSTSGGPTTTATSSG